MTFVSIAETFAAVIVAIGGYEGVKFLIRRFLPAKSEKRIDNATADQSEIDVVKSVKQLNLEIEERTRNMYEEALRDLRAEYEHRIKELRETNTTVNKINTELNDQITKLYKEISRTNGVVTDKVTKIRELEESRLEMTQAYELQITELTRQLGQQEKLVMFFRSWHCEREYGNRKEDCKRRKPAQNPPLKYCPPEIITSTRTEVAIIETEECTKCKDIQ